MSGLDGEKYCQECTQEGSNGIKVIRGKSQEFNERLKPLIRGNNEDFRPLDLGCPSPILLGCGMPNLPIQISIKKLNEKMTQCNHPFKATDIAHLPEYIASPIAVFRSMKTVEDTKVVLTELQCANTAAHIVVIIAPNVYIKYGLFNTIKSLYPKDNFIDILRWVSEHKLLEWADKKKFLDWLDKQRSNSADVTQLIKDTAKIVNSM
jgi:Phage MuF-C-terminal domain